MSLTKLHITYVKQLRSSDDATRRAISRPVTHTGLSWLQSVMSPHCWLLLLLRLECQRQSLLSRVMTYSVVGKSPILRTVCRAIEY